MGSVRWEAAYRLSLVPWASRPRAWAPRVSSLITISDGLGPISNPSPPLATCRNQQRMMSSYAHDLNEISHGIEPDRLAASSTEAHDKPALCS